jgi:hypothetical protein
MMSDALRIGQAQQGIEQKKLTDVVDSLYKGALIEDIENRGEISKINAQTALAQQMRRSPLELPGLGELDFETWKSLDTKTKAYSYYAFNAKQNNEEVMPYSEWSRQTDKPTLFEYYELAKEDPEFKTFLDQYNESKATQINIGQQVEKAEALKGVEAKTYFTSHKGLVKDVDAHVESDQVQNKLMQHAGEPEKLREETLREKEKFIDRQIKSSGGKIIDKQLDGSDFVWVVEWPDGSTSEVRYGN